MNRYPDNNDIATIILRQLGGVRFMALTGSHSPFAITDGLLIKLRKNKAKANKLRIVLTPNDLYRVEFWSCRGTTSTIKVEFDDVYNDQLQEIFESVTGLLTHF